MGTAERRKRERQQRVDLIVDTAEELFFSKGFDTTTMDEIADKAELSKGTLYIYFKSKEDIYLKIIGRGLEKLNLFFKKHLAKCRNGLEKVVGIGDGFKEFFFKHPDYFDALLYYENKEIMLREINEPLAQLISKGSDVLEILINAIKEGIKDGSVREDLDPGLTAVSLWGSSAGILQLMTNKGELIKSMYSLKKDDMISYHFGLLADSIKSQ